MADHSGTRGLQLFMSGQNFPVIGTDRRVIAQISANDELLSEAVPLKRILQHGEFTRLICAGGCGGGDPSFELHEMTPEVLDRQVAGVLGKEAFILVGNEFEDVSEIVNGIVDWRGSQEKELLGPRPFLMKKSLEATVARFLGRPRPGNPGISKMAGLSMRITSEPRRVSSMSRSDFSSRLWRSVWLYLMSETKSLLRCGRDLSMEGSHASSIADLWARNSHT